MSKQIEKNDDGTLTQEQAEKFSTGVAEIVLKTFARIAELTPEQIVDITRNRTESEALLPLSNDVFQTVVEADLPAAFNQYIGQFSNHILQEVFDQVVEKINQNEQAVIVKQIGVEYHDLSPKDVVDYLEANKEV